MRVYLASLPKFPLSARLLGHLAPTARLVAHLALSTRQYVREIERSCLVVAFVSEHSKLAGNSSLVVPLYLSIPFYFQF
jgi:hypothetical protein